jgi:hypothetical protein
MIPDSTTKTPKILAAVALVGGLGVVEAYRSAGLDRFWANWICWFVFLYTIALGSLFIVALQHLVSATWSVPIRRIPERLATLLVPVTPVALLSLFAAPVLLPGTRPEASHNRVLAGKAFWLGLPFLSVRTVVCVALCLVALAVLVRGSILQDRTKSPLFNVRARWFAPLFMGIFALVVTVVAFDWISGLVPEWYSDILGIYLFAGAFLSGLAATSLAIARLKQRGRLAEVRSDHLYNLGAFSFAFTVFWAYIAFAQYLLMWYADLPEEVNWFRARLQGGWHHVSVALVVIHFVIPFFFLVTRDAKGDIRRLKWVAVLMLCAHALDIYWLVFPVLDKGVVFSWPELSFAALFVSGTLLWLRKAFRWGQDMPVGDPFLQEGLALRL